MLEKIKEGLLPIIASFECHLDLMEYVKEKGEWYLRVFIEKNDGNLDMDTCVAVSEAVSEKLDELDLIRDEYYLEVSSPGLERKFKSEKEFIIFKGKRISLKLKEPLLGETEKIFKGEIIDYDYNEGLTFFRFDDGCELQIPKENIQSAKLYID